MVRKKVIYMDPVIQIKKISKSFDEKKVLKQLEMTIQEGEIVAIIGTSGGGKSTLVRCVAGLESVDEGSIQIAGKTINSVKDVVGKVGMVFQNFNLFPHLTALENVVHPLRTVQKLPHKKAEDIGNLWLAKVGLSKEKNQFPSTLSGGQKQRVAIARAMAMEPDILIFDEPTSSLDPELAHEVFTIIKKLAEEGQTMILVTHQIHAIRNIATRVVFLKEGSVAAEGVVDEMFDHPADPDLLQFLKIIDLEDFREVHSQDI